MSITTPIQPGAEEIARFARRFGEPHLQLATLCSLPLILTPDLVGFLRSKYLRRVAPWVAEADLLLSDLCREVGYEQYAMHAPVRARLVARAKLTMPATIEPAARSLIAYIRQLEHSNPKLSKEFLRTQQWGALAFLEDEKDRAASAILEALLAAQAGSAGQADIGRVNQLVRLTKALAPELQNHGELLEYATEIRNLLARGASIPASEGVKPGPVPEAPETIDSGTDISSSSAKILLIDKSLSAILAPTTNASGQFVALFAAMGYGTQVIDTGATDLEAVIRWLSPARRVLVVIPPHAVPSNAWLSSNSQVFDQVRSRLILALDVKESKLPGGENYESTLGVAFVGSEFPSTLASALLRPQVPPDIEPVTHERLMHSPIRRGPSFTYADKADLGRLHGSLRRGARAPAGSHLLWVTNDYDKYAYGVAFMEGLGFQVTIAGSTEAALDAIRTTPFMLVVSDVSRSPDRQAWRTLADSLPLGFTGRFVVYSHRSTRSYKEARQHPKVAGSSASWDEFLTIVDNISSRYALPGLVEVSQTQAGNTRLGVAFFADASNSYILTISDPETRGNYRVRMMNALNEAEAKGSSASEVWSAFGAVILRVPGRWDTAAPALPSSVSGGAVVLPSVYGHLRARPNTNHIERSLGRLMLRFAESANLGAPLYDSSDGRLVAVVEQQVREVAYAVSITSIVRSWKDAPPELRRLAPLAPEDEQPFLTSCRLGSPSSPPVAAAFCVGGEEQVSYVVTSRFALADPSSGRIEASNVFVDGRPASRVWQGEGPLDLAVIAVEGRRLPSTPIAGTASFGQTMRGVFPQETRVVTNDFQVIATDAVANVVSTGGARDVACLLVLELATATMDAFGHAGGPCIMPQTGEAVAVLVGSDGQTRAYATPLTWLTPIWPEMPLELALRLGATSPLAPLDIQSRLVERLSRTSTPMQSSATLISASTRQSIDVSDATLFLSDAQVTIVYRVADESHLLSVDFSPSGANATLDSVDHSQLSVWYRDKPSGGFQFAIGYLGHEDDRATLLLTSEGTNDGASPQPA